MGKYTLDNTQDRQINRHITPTNNQLTQSLFIIHPTKAPIALTLARSSGRYLSDKPLARIMHYADVPQDTSTINSSYEGDANVWKTWQVLVDDQWTDDPSFEITCARE